MVFFIEGGGGLVALASSLRRSADQLCAPSQSSREPANRVGHETWLNGSARGQNGQAWTNEVGVENDRSVDCLSVHDREADLVHERHAGWQ